MQCLYSSERAEKTRPFGEVRIFFPTRLQITRMDGEVAHERERSKTLVKQLSHVRDLPVQPLARDLKGKMTPKLFRLVAIKAGVDDLIAKVESRALKLGEIETLCAADELGKSGYLKGIVVKVLRRGASIQIHLTKYSLTPRVWGSWSPVKEKSWRLRG